MHNKINRMDKLKMDKLRMDKHKMDKQTDKYYN